MRQTQSLAVQPRYLSTVGCSQDGVKAVPDNQAPGAMPARLGQCELLCAARIACFGASTGSRGVGAAGGSLESAAQRRWRGIVQRGYGRGAHAVSIHVEALGSKARCWNLGRHLLGTWEDGHKARRTRVSDRGFGHRWCCEPLPAYRCGGLETRARRYLLP